MTSSLYCTYWLIYVLKCDVWYEHLNRTRSGSKKYWLSFIQSSVVVLTLCKLNTCSEHAYCVLVSPAAVVGAFRYTLLPRWNFEEVHGRLRQWQAFEREGRKGIRARDKSPLPLLTPAMQARYREEQEPNKGCIGEKKRASCLISTMWHEAFLERYWWNNIVFLHSVY